MSNQQVWIIGALITYFTICILLGLYSNRKSKLLNTRDFLTASGSIAWWINGICVFAAFNSGGALMGNFGVAYAGGWGFQTTCNAGAAVGMLVAAFLVAKPLRNLRIATIPEFFRKRYNNKLLHALVPLVVIITITAYTVAQMKVAGMLGEKIIGLPYEWGVILIAAVFIFYTAIGGMWSITLTDLFQGMVMLFVLTFAGILCFQAFGSPTELYSQAVSLRPQWGTNTSSSYPYISFIGGFFTWVFVQSCLPHTIIRVFSAENEKSGRIALSFGSFLISAFAVLALIYITGAAVIINGGQDLPAYDYVFMTVIDKLFPTWFQAIVYAGVFAAVMSSVSGMLLAIGSAASYDLVQAFRPETPEATIKKLSVAGIVVFGIIASVIALNPPALLTILYASAMGMLASCLSVPLILGIWWKRINATGATAGVIVGMVVFLYLYIFGGMPPLSQVTIALPISAAVTVFVSLLTPQPTDEELSRVAIAHERELLDAEI